MNKGEGGKTVAGKKDSGGGSMAGADNGCGSLAGADNGGGGGCCGRSSEDPIPFDACSKPRLGPMYMEDALGVLQSRSA
jgi:hypothetical protein